VPGFPGAHSQGETLDELQENMREVIAMLLEDGEPALETEFVGIQTVQVDAAEPANVSPATAAGELGY
jgi:predicted RNase H-like HicB family nuclease